MTNVFKKILSVFLSVSVLCAGASALAHGIWGTEEQIAEQDKKIEVCSASEYVSFIETTDDGVVVSGRINEKEGMPLCCVITNGGIVEMMQDSVRAKGYYSFFISGRNFSGASTYSVHVASGNSSVALDYYHRTDADNAQLLNEINQNVSAGVLENPKLNLNLYNYNLLENKQDVCDALDSKKYTSVNEFVNAFYNILYGAVKENTNITFYVSPLGSDANPGTQTEPFATVNKAYTVISNMVKDGNAVSDINVILDDGEYSIDRTLSFTDENTSRRHNINISAKNSSKAVITGGGKISGFTRYNGNIYVKNIGEGKDVFMLYNHNEMMWVARYPNRGALKYDLPNDYAQTIASAADKRTAAYIEPSVLSGVQDNSQLEIGIWPNGGDGGNWMWYFNTVDVASADSGTGYVTFTKPTTHDIGSGARYYIQNDLSFLDSENEFYYDKKSGNLYVYAENPSALDITLPLADNIFEFENAKNVKLEGLKIQNSKRTKDYTYTYSTNDSGNGVKISNSDNITVKNCIISNVGGHGIYMVNGGENNAVEANEVCNTFGSGISINGEKNPGMMNFKNNVVSDNYIHSTGLVVGNSTGIALYHGGADNNIIRNNLIADCPRSGIRVTYVNGENYIIYNDVSDVNKGSQDTGVVYVEGLGRNAKTHIENNYIHDSHSWIESTIGIYLDDSAFGTIAKNNIIANLGTTEYSGTSKFGYCMHLKADDIVAENNYIIDNPTALTVIGSYGQHSTANNIRIVRNVISNSGNSIYTHTKYDENRIKEADYNLFDTCNTPTCKVNGANITMNAWRDNYNHDIHSLFDGAMISDSANLDFRLSENSPAYTLGVEDIDIANIGLTEKFVYNSEDNAPYRVFVRADGQDKDRTAFDMITGSQNVLKTLSRNKAGMVAQNVKYTFESENPNVATVDENGAVTAHSVGAARIIVTASNGAVSKKSYITANVKKPTVNIKSVNCFDENNKLVTSQGERIEKVVAEYEGFGLGADVVAAVYDRSGRMLSINANKMPDSVGGTVTVNTSYTGENAAMIKVFVWNMSAIEPFACEKVLFNK